MKSFKTPTEIEIGQEVEALFEAGPDTVGEKLDSFTKYVRRPTLKRFLAMYEIFKKVLAVKGSVVDCGVYRGFSLMAWAQLSAILEPENLTRRVYAFDSFDGFPETSERDTGRDPVAKVGELGSASYDELVRLLELYDRTRPVGHIPKVELIRGDAVATIPAFIGDNPHVVVSLLFLDFDLYEPTRAALEHFLPRMPKGAIVAFDELDNPAWPGETGAAMDAVGLNNLELRRIDWDPYIAFARIE